MTGLKNRGVVLPLILAVLVAGATGCVKGKTQVNTQEREQVYAEMKTFAEQKLGLTAVPCGELPIVTPDTPCYVTDLKAAEVRARLDGDDALRPLGGWRDDYGVTSGKFAWRDSAWKFGVVYARADLEDYQERPDIRDREGLVHIVINAL